MSSFHFWTTSCVFLCSSLWLRNNWKCLPNVSFGRCASRNVANVFFQNVVCFSEFRTNFCNSTVISHRNQNNSKCEYLSGHKFTQTVSMHFLKRENHHSFFLHEVCKRTRHVFTCLVARKIGLLLFVANYLNSHIFPKKCVFLVLYACFEACKTFRNKVNAIFDVFAIFCMT